MAVLECNRTVQTTMVWFAYEVTVTTYCVYNINLLEWLDLGRLSNLCDAQVELTKSGNGMVEKLSEIQVSFCNPWSSVIDFCNPWSSVIDFYNPWSSVIESFSDQWNRSKLPVKFDQHPWPNLELWPSQTCVQIWSWNRWDQGSICIHRKKWCKQNQIHLWKCNWRQIHLYISSGTFPSIFCQWSNWM